MLYWKLFIYIWWLYDNYAILMDSKLEYDVLMYIFSTSKIIPLKNVIYHPAIVQMCKIH